MVSGTVTLTSNCAVGGSIYAGGTVTLSSTPKVAGSIISVGNISTQSTAKIGHDVYTAGTFSSIDGQTTAQLQASGALGGSAYPGSTVPSVSVSLPAPTTLTDYRSGQALTWTQFMNQTARANNAPTWSQVSQQTRDARCPRWVQASMDHRSQSPGILRSMRQDPGALR